MTLHQSTATDGRSSPISASTSAAVEYLLHRLDCEIDALRGEDLSAYRAVLARLSLNLTDIMETTNGHAH